MFRSKDQDASRAFIGRKVGEVSRVQAVTRSTPLMKWPNWEFVHQAIAAGRWKSIRVEAKGSQKWKVSVDIAHFRANQIEMQVRINAVCFY
jgi:hypothetical protein